MTLKLFGLERNLDEAGTQYVYSIFEPASRVKHVMTDSKAGTGKTTLAVASSVLLRKEMKYEGGLFYFTFPTQRAERLGSTTGDLDPFTGKEAKYMRPFRQAMKTCGVPESMYGLYKVEMSTASDYRGGNINNAIVIIDEAQNGSIEDLQLVYTRCDDDCKIITCGSSRQCDNPKLKRYGKAKLLPFQIYMIHQLKKGYSKKHTLILNHRGEQANHSDDIQETIKELESGFYE